VHTPDTAMDLMLNRWLLYQAIVSRIRARTGFYQSSGAFGFRDQLQDVMALVHTDPQSARAHILEASRHQFVEGDVLYWWHPPSGRGVRTRISDDLLWLPYAVAKYIDSTGDDALMREAAPFLQAAPLKPDEEDRYGFFETTAESYTIYEHCLRAIQVSLTFGPHHLPLMRAGDWNDGMNRVGIQGRGESIWLGWFLRTVLQDFARLSERLGEQEHSSSMHRQAVALAQNLEKSGWGGGLYLRAFYDDGTPLGSASNTECRIDSIPQSWAVLSGSCESQRGHQAMESVWDNLVLARKGLILLLTPPFDGAAQDPGYIKGYPPGVRENGGQYTHAAAWAAWAFAALGQGSRAEQLFHMLNPIYHADAPAKAARYHVEPYVIAGDIGGVPPHDGRGGWTWYTGSAGWCYRLGLEAILGFRKAGAKIRMDPCILDAWPVYEMEYQYGQTVYRIRVENPDRVQHGVRKVTLDGKPLPGQDIPLADNGRPHRIRVVLGREGQAAK
jgi:cellobiose phosphorylase